MSRGGGWTCRWDRRSSDQKVGSRVGFAPSIQDSVEDISG